MDIRDMQVKQDSMGTHMDWKHEGITAHMIDWFWSNMEKGILLWHPEQHEPLEWAVPVTPGDPRGSVHIAPQTWNDGKKKATPEEGMIWAAHCGQEIGNWGVFLPQLYELYKVVKNPLYNPFADLAVEGKGRDARYRFLPQA
ncbi:hypothetical protein [Holophaga foetida]|uniref:hypothetical protein n=1 Tax=Holophaga foetida TaxID=35839 RepID=UPI00024746A0|nr:hypothetical protein [Holophaga foetida]